MPKEEIHPHRNAVAVDGGPGSTSVVVHWGREGSDVMVGTVDALIPPGEEGRGWFVNLDRSEVNRLIRVLRKARDQAYGRDE